MRYKICRPTSDIGLDPRTLKLGSLQDLWALGHAPEIEDHDSELAAAYAVRRIYPDAICMPVPLSFGADNVVVLGVLDKARQVSADQRIPFQLIVIASPETNYDKDMIRKQKQWDQRKWKPPVVRPDMAQPFMLEIRANDLQVPVHVRAEVGYYQGRLAIRTELDGYAMSLVFTDRDVRLTSEGTATVAGDGSGDGERANSPTDPTAA